MKSIIGILLLVVTYAQAQEKIQVFKTTISSQEVRGQKKFGPSKGDTLRVLISDLFPSNSATQYLGQVNLNGELRNPVELLNIRSATFIPILDSINFDYYMSSAIPNKLDSIYYGFNEKYKAFREKFMDDKMSNKQRKAFLYLPDNIRWRRELERSRYYYQDSTSLKNKEVIEKAFKISLASTLKAILLGKKLNLTAKANTEISNLVNSTVKIEGSYYEVYLDDAYVSSVAQILRNVNVKDLNTNNIFNTNFKRFYQDGLADIIAGIAILQLSFDYNKVKTFKAGLGTLIDANFQKNSNVDANEITAQLESSYAYLRDKSGSSQYNTYINLRYYYSPQLMIGLNGNK